MTISTHLDTDILVKFRYTRLFVAGRSPA